ncbi:hypothetical protein LXL04_017071 [Taraxacum kok-saghyz]
MPSTGSSWLRGEFAAANAIIDSLCHHLKAVGEPGEEEERRGRKIPATSLQPVKSFTALGSSDGGCADLEILGETRNEESQSNRQVWISKLVYQEYVTSTAATHAMDWTEVVKMRRLLRRLCCSWCRRFTRSCVEVVISLVPNLEPMSLNPIARHQDFYPLHASGTTLPTIPPQKRTHQTS